MPRTIKHLEHNSGGRILRVHAIGHRSGPEESRGGSYDYVEWFYVCNVAWADGSGDPQRKHDVSPAALCWDHHGENADEAYMEYKALHGELEKYLATNGRWVVDVGWIPKERSGSVPVNEVEEVVDGSN